jgi:hypothetical protein
MKVSHLNQLTEDAILYYRICTFKQAGGIAYIVSCQRLRALASSR